MNLPQEVNILLGFVFLDGQSPKQDMELIGPTAVWKVHLPVPASGSDEGEQEGRHVISLRVTRQEMSVSRYLFYI